MLFKKVYDLNNYNLLETNEYVYSNNYWKDQLTKFNNDVITYDEIGNPLRIGENITLDWVNGRQLNSYNDSQNIISYKYNKDGIRTSKIVNGMETKYFVEGDNIILEQNGDNMIIHYIKEQFTKKKVYMI